MAEAHLVLVLIGAIIGIAEIATGSMETAVDVINSDTAKTMDKTMQLF